MRIVIVLLYIVTLNAFFVMIYESNRLKLLTPDEPRFYYSNNRKVYEYVNLHMLKLNNHTMRDLPNEGFLSDVSIFTQITKNRLSRLKSMAQRWNYNLHCVLYVTEYSNRLELFQALPLLQEIYDQEVFSRVHLHLVVDRDATKNYPINELRNIAWSFVKTKYAFSLDVDFVPSPDFEENIQKLTPSFLKTIDDKNLFVIPAFHYECKVTSDVQTCEVDREFQEVGQNATDYNRWKTAQEPYLVSYEVFYEPYFLGPTKLPRYDEIFDIGNDKTSHLYELAAAGYKFWIIPHAWIAHIPHAYGVKHSLEGGKYNYNRAWAMWEKFVYKIARQYGFDMYCRTDQDLKMPLLPYHQNQRRHAICG